MKERVDTIEIVIDNKPVKFVRVPEGDEALQGSDALKLQVNSLIKHNVELIRKAEQDKREMVNKLFAPNYYPSHFKLWAEQIDREYGYKGSTLAVFLYKLADNFETLKKELGI